MAGGNLMRRLRGLVGNAIVWGAGWAGLSFAIFAVMRLFNFGPHTWLGVLQSSAMFGVVGAAAGTIFSTFIALLYRGRRLSEISWLRFGIGGGILTALFVPTWIVVLRFLSGDPWLPARYLFSNSLIGLAFGTVAAAVTMKVAQMAEGLGGGSGAEPELLDSGYHPAATGFGPQQHAAVRKPDGKAVGR